MRTELQPFLKSDIKVLISWIRTPDELFMWSADTFTFPLDEKQLEKHAQEASGPGGRLMYKAVDARTKEPVGHIELTRIDRDKGKASIAYVLVDPERRGLGYGKAMIQNILHECFDQMKLSKVDLFVFEFNTVAIQCYQSTGFQLEDVIKDRVKLNEKFVPLYLMGLNEEKWNYLKQTG